MADFTVGMAVLYSPAESHQLDKGFVPGEGGLVQLFHFAHAKGHGSWRPGDPVEPWQMGTGERQVGTITGWEGRAHASNLLTDRGCVLSHAGPKHYWPAVIVAVNADGTCDLDVKHPNGLLTLHYPDRSERPVPVLDKQGQPTGEMALAAPHKDAPGVRYDPKGKAPHTFHLAEG